ncbi:GTP-binding protein [uncultured Maribacter sp.]|uniref:GTP-binding protein n=1 Tax=uncultured Maribacter sp. TaxID=431308 RepID=UPI0026115056|nr:GTP-binding protein [uncultured Maribacter sp.]
MKPLPNNDIALRPRFQLDINKPKQQLLAAFDIKTKPPFLINKIDDHIFIKFNKEKIHFWSPQLHLEITKKSPNTSKIYGLFGPNPTLWTFFMFLHFGVAILFVTLSVWAYSSASLNKPYYLQLGLMVAMIILWFTLYAFGRIGRKKGKPQMHMLNEFINTILDIS